MIKIMAVFGTRPEAIKMCPLINVLKEEQEFKIIVAVTAQHRQMLDQVLSVFQIVPDYDLNIMKNKQDLVDITCNVIRELNKIIVIENPDLVLVHGDTTTTFAASLVAFYNKVPLGHVEAGLRTSRKYSPFPEEMNRRLTSDLTDLHFSPTDSAKDNLLKEGKKKNSIFVTGNTAIDALKYTVKMNYTHPILEKINHIEKEKLEKQRIILLTTHRRENIGENMIHIFQAVVRIVNEFENIHVIFPVHLNPVIQNLSKKYLSGYDRVHLIQPLDVVGFHNLESKAFLILTDSGGIQEEAPFFGVPVLVLRNNTERPEGVKAGTLKLVGTNQESIYNETKQLIINQEKYKKMSGSKNPFGDGHASEKITKIIKEFFISQI